MERVPTSNMEKESENTLDLVLDIQNSISLNPFDRPPNIMDDDLNSVTQEELEANLSTDCPQSNMESTTPTSLEQLIQRVLEDTSTQDAVEQQDEYSDTSSRGMCSSPESEILGILTKENIKADETETAEDDGWQESVVESPVDDVDTTLENVQNDVDTILENVQNEKPDLVTSASMETVENSKEHTVDDGGLNTTVKKEVSDISVGSEKLLTQNVDNCYYADTIRQEDIDNELCEVEVYDGEREIKKESSDENDDDNLSTKSSLSLGHSEEADVGANENPDNDNVSQLSIIISDHCYSQEKVSTKETNVLKQNLLNYMLQRSQTKNNHEKISTLVDNLFNELDTDNIEILLSSLNMRQESLVASDTPTEGVDSENPDDSVSSLRKDTTEEEAIVTEQDKSKNLQEFNATDIDVNLDNHEVRVAENLDISQESKVTDTYNNETIDTILNESKEITNNEIDKEQPLNEVNVPMEDEKGESTALMKDDNHRTSSQSTENVTTQESIDSKSVSESLADNCSEPLEHHIFEEEFELLCKNGNLTLDKYKPDISSNVLNKLTDFVTNMQKDCQSFSSASTNIEQRLHHYIHQQFEHFQETFKPYCGTTTTSNKKSIETQTDFRKLTKHHRREMNMESKKNLLKTSDNSSQSSSSSMDDEDLCFNKAPKRKRIKRSSTKTKSHSSDPETASRENEKSVPLSSSQTANIATNHSQEYDDGINLSQYVQSEIFDIESASQQSPLPSSVEDSDASVKEEGVQSNYLVEDGDSDSTILYKPKKKSATNPDVSGLSSSETKISRKSRNDDISVNSESDKENLSSGRNDKKSHDSIDDDEKNDKEIERLINIDGLAKRSIANSTSTKSSEKCKSKAPATKNLNDPFDFMDVEFGSDDEVKSEAEEELITEKQFLERRNEDIKRQMLDDSSTDSEELNEEDDELLKGASEEDDESGKNSPLVEKFLKSFVVDDSDNDNDVVDEDDDIDLDSDKEATASSTIDTANKADEPITKETEVVAGDENEAKKANNSIEADGESPTASDIELLNDNLLFRKRGSRPQKLDKMLSDAEKRKRISKIDEELISLSSDTENSDVEAIDVEPSQSTKPRAIKPMLRPDQLAGETIKAQKHENERISRLERKHNMLDKILKDHPDADKNKELILDYIKDTKTFIKVHPGIVKHLKPHQFDGVRFMYDSCYGGVDSLKKSPGSGCILAHCMGLGKTLQLIALLHTVISFKELKTTKILVLCPKSTVMNWADEIIRWLGPLRQKNLKVYTFNDTSDIYEKLSILREWSLSNHTRAGCLLIGYEAFRTLVFYHSYKNRGNVSAHRLEEIRKNVNTYLLQPGADLVICDEGHIIKNSKSAISTAVAQIVTPRRIVLTGTPIQNNLKEYYSMVNFIKPLFLGTEKEFANLYANPIKNGQHKDSGKTDIKVMKQRSFVLHKKLSKFVQRKEAELLKTFLPQKFEYVLFVPMTDVQNNLYQHILNTITNRDETYRGKGLITDYTCLRKIWTHPKVLEDAWKNAVNQRNKKELRQKQKDHNSEDDQPDDIYDSQTGQMSVTNDWWRSLVTERDLESVMPSNKLRTMFKILQMCEEKGEKCLIFSAFVAVLNVVEYFFRKITDNDQTVRNELTVNTHSQWVLGKDYYRLDGKTPKSIRHAMINEFNNVLNKRARVFLISAKAGGQGINLIGANRVMILDTSWNPSNDQQNIFRVFRLGQKRNCYIYRLLAMGTMEEKVYSRSVTKQAMSFRVVDEQQIDRHYNMAELAELYILTIPDHNNRPTPILPQDSVLARLLRSFPDLVYKYHEHDSLLENKVEQELSEQEKNEAWTAYERDLQMNSEIRELPNMEELQNKFNPSNLANYMSPFSGLDVSNTANTNNIPKNMSHFFGGTRGFTQPLLQSLLGPNSNAATTQQYIEMFNYYKNLGTYADLNSYSTLSAMGAGRMPGGPSTSSAANPLAALGDLSMYGLGSPALQGLGPSSANSMNLANSVLAGALPPMPTPPSSASMYTSSAPSMLASTANAALSSAGLTNTTNSAAALTAFEQYTQSLRSSFPNMYSYAGDFGIGSSGSTILDKSKSGKNAKHSSGGSNSKNTTNLPGGSKGGGNSMSLYPGSSVYLTQHQQQSRPSSRNTPTDLGSKAKNISTASSSMATASSNSMTTSSANSMAMAQNMSNSTKTNTNDVQNNLINYRRSDSSGSNSIASSKSTPVSNQKRGNTDFPNGSGANKTAGSGSSTLNSKQSSKSLNPTPPIQPNTNQNNPQKSSSLGTIGPRSTKSSNVDNNRPMNMGVGSTKSANVDNNRTMNMTAGSTKSSTVDNNRPMNMAAGSAKSSNVDNSRPMNMPTGSTKTSNMENNRSMHVPTSTSKSSNVDNSRSIHVAKGSTKSSNVDNSRSVNMGILYPNSKGQDKTSSTKSNSPMNMGIVYPRSGKSSTSEMQIIPTSSPPGTTSISKQLNDLSPSISLTAVKNTGPTKSSNANTKSSTTTPQTIHINKVIQNNTTIRRTTSPVTASPANNSKSSATNSNNSSITGTNQGNILARLKAASNKKTTNAGNSNTNPPPLHRANTTLGTTSNSSAVNITAKSTSGLTITNVKPPMKPQNAANKPQLNTSSNLASTFAKQQAAASVAKSNIQRTSTPTSNVINPTSNTSSNLQKTAKSPSLPSLTSIKRTIIKRASPNTSASNILPALSSSSSVTVTTNNKLPIISSVKSISPSMATISKASLGKTNLAGTLQNKQNLQSVSNVSKTIAQMQKRLPASMTASAASTSSAAANNTANTVRNTVNIRPVDNKQNSSGIGGGVYIIETNINDKKVAIGAPTKSGGGTTVTKVPLQNPNKRKATDPLPKDVSIDSKRMKN